MIKTDEKYLVVFCQKISDFDPRGCSVFVGRASLVSVLVSSFANGGNRTDTQGGGGMGGLFKGV